MANIINITESANRLEFSDAYSPIVCGNSNYYLHFTFDEIWKRCQRKTALFVVDGKKMYVDFEGEDVRVPVLPNAPFVFVSLISGEGNNQIATTSIKIRLEPTALGGDMSEFDQLSSCLPKVYAAVNDLQNGAIVAKQAENANFASEAVLAGTANLANEALVAQNVSNPNLLINGEFRVNQRGASVYTENNKYSVDRWLNIGTACEVISGGVKVALSDRWTSFRQYVEDYEYLKGKAVTLSCKVINAELERGDTWLQFEDGVGEHRVQITGEGIFKVTGVVSASATKLDCRIYTFGEKTGTDIVDLEYIKLELGATPTPNTPRPYAQELAMCQRYYLKMKSTNAYTVYVRGWFNSGTTNLDCLMSIPSPMRIKPTMVMNGKFAIVKTIGGALGIISFFVHTLYDNQLMIRCVSSDGIKGQECIVQSDNDTSTSIEFDAEMY